MAEINIESQTLELGGGEWKTNSFKLPEQLSEALKKVSKAKGMKASEYVRKLLNQALLAELKEMERKEEGE